jgi:SAM-dependent methyltransferase
VENTPFPGHEGDSALDRFRGVLDRRDVTGVKNDLIHRIHTRTLSRVARPPGLPRYATAIDFGCGLGRLTPTLLELADTVIGIDRDPTMLERARREHDSSRTRYLTPGADLRASAPTLVVAVYVLCIIPRADVVDILTDLRVAAGAAPRCVIIDRVVRAPECDPGDIEARSEQTYCEILAEAGWTPGVTRRIRRADSLPMTLNLRGTPRLPGALRGPVTAAFARMEYARAPRDGRGDYVDMVMTAGAP